MSIGENIKQFRTKNGLTQKQLGEKCGMADSAIRRYELGKANPKIETLQKIADALDVFVTDLNPQLNDTLSILREKKNILFNEKKKALNSFSKDDFFGDEWNSVAEYYDKKINPIKEQLKQISVGTPDQYLYEKTGETIKRVRLKKGISLKDFSKNTQIPIPLLIRIEKGLRSLTHETLYKISKYLNIPMNELDANLFYDWGFDNSTPQDISYKTLLDNYEQLNEESQKKVVEYTELLLKIPDCREADNSDEELENKISTKQNPPAT